MPPRHTLAAPLAAGALLLSGCASRANAPADQVSIRPTTTRVDTPSGYVETRTTAEDRAEAIVVKVAPDAAWSKIASVYAELGLPVNTFVDATRQIGAKGVRVRGRLGSVRTGQLVRCGADMTGEDRANSYEVTLDVASAVGPAPNGQTQVLTMVVASARPMSTSGDPVRCVTTGSLEKRIANAVLVKAGVGP